jgi:hypothetical protein
MLKRVVCALHKMAVTSSFCEHSPSDSTTRSEHSCEVRPQAFSTTSTSLGIHLELSVASVLKCTMSSNTNFQGNRVSSKGNQQQFKCDLEQSDGCRARSVEACEDGGTQEAELGKCITIFPAPKVVIEHSDSQAYNSALTSQSATCAIFW